MAKPVNNSLKPFHRTLGISDFTSANVTLVGSTFSRVGAFTVGAGQEATFGVSVLRSGGVEGEPVYMKFVNESGTAITGLVRFFLANAQETNRVVVMEQRTERLSASQNDRTQAPLLPEFGLNALEDSKLIIEFREDSGSNQTFDYNGTDAKFLIPVTIYQ